MNLCPPAFALLTFITSLILPTLAAQAQSTITIGPKVGLKLSSAHFPQGLLAGTDLRYRPGLTAGVMGAIRQGHFALQPALIYSQQGFTFRNEDVELRDRNNILIATGSLKDTKRLHYITLPLNVSYTLRADGQGFQVFAGPYVALLLGGRSHGRFTAPGIDPIAETSKITVVTGEALASGGSYVRRYDAGAQAELGYRFGPALVQAEYSIGLRTLQPGYTAFGNPVTSPDYYNRAFQLSFAYLFGVIK